MSPFILAGSPLPLLDPTRIYVCGITPYDVTHLGHASTFVWNDVLARVLRTRGITPITTRNVTDVDDVLTAAAQRAGAREDRFAYLQQYDFDRDMATLGVRRPDHEPRARHHIPGVQRLAHLLIETGSAYVSEGSVYFDGSTVPTGVGLTDDEAERLSKEYGGRLDDPAKRDRFDVAIWQASKADEPSWDSPWGPGRPGWHAECAAMSIATYGPALDIHSGGADLTFPHHAYESAIAEAVTGVAPYARRWFRIGIVGIDGAKMAKSTGNLVLVSDLLALQPAQVIRLMLLDRPWSQPWDYTPDELDRAADRLSQLRAAAARGGSDDDARATIAVRLADDLDVAGAIDAALAAGGAPAAELCLILGL